MFASKESHLGQGWWCYETARAAIGQLLLQTTLEGSAVSSQWITRRGKRFPAAGAQPLSKCRWSVIRSPCDEQAGNQKKREPSGIAVQKSLASLNPRDRLERPG